MGNQISFICVKSDDRKEEQLVANIVNLEEQTTLSPDISTEVQRKKKVYDPIKKKFVWQRVSADSLPIKQIKISVKDMKNVVLQNQILMGEPQPQQILPLERYITDQKFKQLLKSQQPQESPERVNILECFCDDNNVYTFRMKIDQDDSTTNLPQEIPLDDYIQHSDKTIMNLSYTVYYPDRYEQFNENNQDIIQIQELAELPLVNFLAQYHYRPVSFYEKIGSNFSMRCPKGFKQIGILFSWQVFKNDSEIAISWLATDSQNFGNKVVVKQVPKDVNPISKIDKKTKGEIAYYRAVQRAKNSQKQGIQMNVKLIQIIESEEDIWFQYEYLQNLKPLGELKGIFPIQQDPLQNMAILKIMIIKVVQYMQILNSERLVFANLKPQNIWLDLGAKIEMKIVDYSQVITFENLKFLKFKDNQNMEYYPPEIIEYVRSRNLYKRKKTQDRQKCPEHQLWSLDMWALGMLILEIIQGHPLQIVPQKKVMFCTQDSSIGSPRSLNKNASIVSVDNNQIKSPEKSDTLKVIKISLNNSPVGLTKLTKTPSLMDKGQVLQESDRQNTDYDLMLKMILKQKYLSQQLPSMWKNIAEGAFEADDDLLDLVQKMINLDPVKRISPQNVMRHQLFTRSFINKI